MDVRFTDDTDIVPAPLKDTPKAKMQDRLLELQAAFYLQDKDPHLRCIPTPPGIGGQIDVYGRKEPIRESTLEILVGECKLRKEGNEVRKPIAFGEVTQTLDNMLAAARYEHRRLDGLKRTPTLKIRGALIANTSGFEGEQEDFYVCVQNYLNDHWPQSVLELCDEVELVLVQATLPSGWTNRADWEINGLTITETWHITGQDIDENWVWDIGVKQS